MTPPPPLDPARDALFLDYDGTLADFVDDPKQARPPMALVVILASLRTQLDGALAIVTGRPIRDLDPLLRPFRTAAAGQHGHEFRPAPRDEAALITPEPAGFADLHAPLQDFVAGKAGVFVEMKPRAYCLHYRAAPEHGPAAAALCDDLAARTDPPLIRIDGRMIAEMKAPGADKGTAIARFLEQPPFAGRRPIFIGDDATDEYGFREVNARGGLSILVGERETAATRRLPDITAVHFWLGLTLTDAAV